MEEEWIPHVGDLVRMAAHRQHSSKLSPGLVTAVIKEASWKFEYNTDWPLLDNTIDCLSGQRIRVLHPDGTLKLWRPGELQRYPG